MRADVPKQYLPLHGRTVLEHTLDRLCAHKKIAGVVLVSGAGDKHLQKLNINCAPSLLHADGGHERCHSVLNGLNRLAEVADEHDWVLVHDAARPCVRLSDIEKLIQEISHHPVGGLLAIPVRETMKRATENSEVYETVNRSGLWHALTPQMFRLGELRAAMIDALDKGVAVTDESSAMELAGKRPQLVEGHADNIKITRLEDLVLAGFYLQQQAQSGSQAMDDGQ